MSHIITTPRTDTSTPGQRTRDHITGRASARQRSDRSAGSTVREIVLVATMFMLYRQVRSLTSGDVDHAMVNADRIVGIERRFGAFSEGSLQRLVLHSRPAIELARMSPTRRRTSWRPCRRCTSRGRQSLRPEPSRCAVRGGRG